MSQALWMRLREVEWTHYKTSSGIADRIPRLLQDISSRKISRAIKANHILWKLICSGGIQHAAQPTIPFLIELSQLVTVEVKVEILDTLKSCTLSLSEINDKNTWQQQTWITLAQALPILRHMRNKGKDGGSNDINITLEPLIETLEKDSNRK